MIKELMKHINEFKKASLLTPMFITLEVVMDVAIPLVMASLIDVGIEGQNMNAIIKIGLCLMAFIAFAMILGSLSGKYAANASSEFARNLRRDMYYNVQKFSFSNIDKYSTAGLVTRLTTDVTNVQNAYQMIIRVAIRCPLMLIFSLFMTYSIKPELSLIYLAVIPVLGVAFYFVFKMAHPVFERVFKTYDQLNNVVQENLTGIRVVKSYVREDYEIKKMEGVSDHIFRDFNKAEKLVATNMPMMQACIYICMLLISWMGAKLIVNAQMTTGQLTSLVSYTWQIMMSMMMLSMVLVMITMAKASAERIVELLNEKSDIQNPAQPIKHVANGDVSFENVGFSYVKDPKKQCLSKVNLEIKSGETIGIIGGTGSAKTSLVQLIARLYDVTQGVVKVGDVDVRDYDLETLRSEVAMVLQKNVLFSGTIKENLRWGNAEASDEELVRVCKLAQADEFIQGFPQGYDTYIEQGGNNVSGGQKQRLCIARALLKKPKILILDDSTSAVDTKTDALIRQAFLKEIPDTTKIIIAQRITSVADADHIIVMESGLVNGFGTHDELLQNNAIYREVYESQVKGGSDDE